MQVLRLKKLMEVSGLSRSTIYDLIKNGTFPKPLKLGPRAVGWLQSDVEAWLSEKRGA
jgi:prophage regulatory protein